MDDVCIAMQESLNYFTNCRNQINPNHRQSSALQQSTHVTRVQIISSSYEWRRQADHRIWIPTMPSAAQDMVANNADNIAVMATSSMTMYTLLVMHSWLGLWLRGIAPLVCIVAACVVKL